MDNPRLGQSTGERSAAVRSDIGLVRPRLIPELDGPFSPRLGMAIGPPGSGKTTLLMQWAARVEGQVWWYRSSGPDAQPGRMLSCFAEALAAAVQAEPARSFSGLAKDAERLERRFHFVVDDFQVLADSSAEADLDHLLALGSPNLVFLIGSRHVPRINLAKSELQTAFTVTGQDLRFRATEIEQLFRGTYRQPLSPEGVANLARRTDGWAAGLHLFHLATRNDSPVEQRRAAESRSATPRLTHDYLTHHFLAGISSDMEQLLRATCLLEVLTPARCDALLERHDGRHLLQELEHLGVISTEDDGAAYRLPQYLQQYLVSDLSEAEPGRLQHLRHRAAMALEQEGAVGEALTVLARAMDWEGVGRLLRRAGASAILPGACAWAALMPDNVLPDDAWATLARARQWFDDGCLASACRAASRIPALTTDRDAVVVARELFLRAAAWSAEGTPAPVSGHPGHLREALHRQPGAVALSLATSSGHHGSLSAGLSFLLAGDQRSALPLLRRAAQRIDVDPASALAAQLALAVFGPDCLSTAAGTAATEIDAVQRLAERRGFTWLGRLARGVQAALPGTPACRDAVIAVIERCEARGDEWGAALVAAGEALMRLREGNPAPESFEALAGRFRRLSAGTPEAWAHAAQALVSASLDLPETARNVRSAEAFARAADVPGALAVAYAATALQAPEDYGDLMRLANLTGQSAGLACRPWTWLARGGSGPRRNVQADRPVTSGVRNRPDQDTGRPAHLPTSCAPLPPLEITCFGGFALRRKTMGLDLSKIRPQAKTVLRILSLNAGRLVHRERLAGILWADLDPAAALHALQVSVSSLRGALQPEGTSDGHQLLVRQGEAYALVLGPGSTFDLADFDHALHSATMARMAGDNAGAAEALHRAVDLYAGEVLPEDGPAEWAADSRESYRLRAAEAASSLAGVELGLGNCDAAAAAATRSVEIDPWRDGSWRTLVETLRRLGDPVAAQRAQKRYDLMLNSLGVPAARRAEGPHDGVIVTTGPGTGPPRRPPLDRRARSSPRS